MIKAADWIVDLGLEGGGGGGGGEVVATGTPEQIGAHPASHTGAVSGVGAGAVERA